MEEKQGAVERLGLGRGAGDTRGGGLVLFFWPQRGECGLENGAKRSRAPFVGSRAGLSERERAGGECRQVDTMMMVRNERCRRWKTSTGRQGGET